VSDQGDNIILPLRTTSSNNININRNAEEDNSSYWLCLRIRLMPLLRVIILIVLIWGVLIGGNVLYLRILLHGTTDEQESFKVFFAAFKLIWTMAVTTFLFESKWLYLGIEEERHDAFISYWLGGKVKMMFAFNAISSFWIPLLTILVGA
jgi:hypothetical protein